MITLNPSGDGLKGDAPLARNQSDMTHSHFGGNREETDNISSPKDYTKRATEVVTTKKENPVDETTRDVDDMSDVNDNTDLDKHPRAKKREFSRRAETEDVQQSNEADWQTKSDPDNRPRMDEGTDGVQVPEATDLRQRTKPNKWQYDTSNTYEGEIS
jgi:hypothetical protein